MVPVVDIAAALEFPTNKEKPWQTVLVGGVVTVFLPGFLLGLGGMVAIALGLGADDTGLLVMVVAFTRLPQFDARR